MLPAINLYTRDSNVSSMDPTAATESAAARPAPPASMWPIVGGARRGADRGRRLVTYPVVFVFGIIALIAAAVEWMVGAWSERASGRRPLQPRRPRSAFPIRLEFPVLALLAAVIIIYSFSRIMLFLSKTGGPAAFAVVAALVLVAGFVVAFRPQIGNAAISGVAAIAVLGLVAGGVAAALAGERDMRAAPHDRRPRRRGRVRHGRGDRGRRARLAERRRQGQHPRRGHPARGRHAGRQGARASTGESDAARRHPFEPDERAVQQRERGGAPPRAQPRRAAGGRRDDG